MNNVHAGKSGRNCVWIILWNYKLSRQSPLCAVQHRIDRLLSSSLSVFDQRYENNGSGSTPRAGHPVIKTLMLSTLYTMLCEMCISYLSKLFEIQLLVFILRNSLHDCGVFLSPALASWYDRVSCVYDDVNSDFTLIFVYGFLTLVSLAFAAMAEQAIEKHWDSWIANNDGSYTTWTALVTYNLHQVFIWFLQPMG